MSNRDTQLLTKLITELITELAKQRRTDKRTDRMLAVIERQHELYSIGFAYADAPSPDKAAELESAGLALAAAALRLAGEGCDLFHFAPKEAAHAG